MIQQVLIANRGEIAPKIIRACRDLGVRLGVRTVAIYFDADKGGDGGRLSYACAELEDVGG